MTVTRSLSCSEPPALTTARDTTRLAPVTPCGPGATVTLGYSLRALWSGLSRGTLLTLRPGRPLASTARLQEQVVRSQADHAE